MVIELPTIFATSSSDYFSKGAINILYKLNIIDTICFGSESGDISILNKIANTIIKNEEYMWKNTSKLMKSGISFASSRSICLKEFLSDKEIEELNKPNNILAIDYIKALNKLNSNILPYTIKREGNNFNENKLNKSTSFASATSIRKNIYNNDIDIIENFVPKETFDLINSEKAVSNEVLFYILKYSILKNANLVNINGVIEGIENKIIKSLNISKTYEEFIHNIKSKRYAMSSIKRILVNIILNITKQNFNEIVNNDIKYAHILSISKQGKKLLSEISKRSNINVLTNINNKVINSLNETDKKCLEIDILSTNIHSSLSNQNINKDYTNKL